MEDLYTSRDYFEVYYTSKMTGDLIGIFCSFEGTIGHSFDDKKEFFGFPNFKILDIYDIEPFYTDDYSENENGEPIYVDTIEKLLKVEMITKENLADCLVSELEDNWESYLLFQ